MICAKCNVEQPDNARFCSQCAAPMAVPARKKLSGWWLALLVVLLVLLGMVIQQNLSNADRQAQTMRESAERQAAIIGPQPHSAVIVNSAATVNAASYAWYTFVVPNGATNISVAGHVTATGGAGNDINCYVLDEDGFANLKNSHPANTYFNSGRVTQAKIGGTLPSAGTYYLILDNQFSVITPKAVQVNATLTYTQ